MVEDQSFRKVKRFIFSVSLFLLLTNLSFAKNFNLEKIVDLNGPWGSSFINNEELIITEKSGKIKVVNIISKQIFEFLIFFLFGRFFLLNKCHKLKSMSF